MDDPPQGTEAPFLNTTTQGGSILNMPRRAGYFGPYPCSLEPPGLWLHPLKSQMKGFWSTVRANWRVIFRFDDGAEDVDYVDYH
jgi:hypothetical protein